MFATNIDYKITKPNPQLSSMVERFWLLKNHSNEDEEIFVIPDGRIDILFSKSTNEPFHVMLIGIETKPSQIIFPAKTIAFGISLNLLAVEYLLQASIANILNQAQPFDKKFFGITKTDLNNFEKFCKKIESKISELKKENIEKRKQNLFDLIYSSNGSLTVAEYSRTSLWETRQINRYFNQYFGIPLKAYCNILRFRASFPHIKEGKLFPQQNFSDQAHFIREVKKLAGVIPKELSKNENEKFIQFSTLPKK